MSRRYNLPPIPNILYNSSYQNNCFDADAFNSQSGINVSKITFHDELARLISKIDSLKSENDILRQELFQVVLLNDDDPMVVLKKKLMLLHDKILKREKEIISTSKTISKMSKTNDLSSIDVAGIENLSFDSLSSKLMLLDSQKSFFSVDDIRKYNEQLKKAITERSKELTLTSKRLELYKNCQKESSVQYTINSLKRGEAPFVIADTYPGRLSEQKMKIRLLRKELKALIQKRKSLLEGFKTKSCKGIHEPGPKHNSNPRSKRKYIPDLKSKPKTKRTSKEEVKQQPQHDVQSMEADIKVSYFKKEEDDSPQVVQYEQKFENTDDTHPKETDIYTQQEPGSGYDRDTEEKPELQEFLQKTEKLELEEDSKEEFVEEELNSVLQIDESDGLRASDARIEHVEEAQRPGNPIHFWRNY